MVGLNIACLPFCYSVLLNGRLWLVNKARLFNAETALAIANLLPLSVSRDDDWIWVPNSKGSFSVLMLIP